MPGSFNVRHASHVLRNGGIIAYPNEGVFGLGCLPRDRSAVHRILALKRRNVSKGLILIASNVSQLNGFAEAPNANLTSSAKQPTTWIVPASDSLPSWILGEHEDVAVRITTHPIARALCDATDSCLVSTSANLAGHATARNTYVLRKQFGASVDFIVPGQCGPALGASEIRELKSGRIVRSA